MTATSVKLIITAEVAGQRFDLGKVEFSIGEKMDETIYQGMQGMGTANLVLGLNLKPECAKIASP